jgi:hypothetical protein
MRARRVIPALLGVVSGIAVAGEPKPTAVEIKAFKDKLIVLEDPQGGTYVVLPGGGEDSRLFFGTTKAVYEQIIINRFANGETGAWDLGVVAPRVPNIQPGSVQRKDDGTFHRWCGSERDTVLKQAPADRAKGILDKASFLSTALTRRSHLLARDDSGVYYYVDVIRDQYGGSGFRVWVGKKGAMKQLPLTDVASDTGGEVFATKSGDVRIVRDKDVSSKATVTFVKGEKHTSLVQLDLDANSRLIFKDLGVYSFLGTICDDL